MTFSAKSVIPKVGADVPAHLVSLYPEELRKIEKELFSVQHVSKWET